MTNTADISSSNITFSSEFRETMARADHYARHLKHEQLLPDHVMLALLDHEETSFLLSAYGVDINAVRAAFTGHLREQDTRLSRERASVPRSVNTQGPGISVDLQRIIEHASAWAAASGLNEIDSHLALAVLLDSPRSKAAAILDPYDLSTSGVVQFIRLRTGTELTDPNASRLHPPSVDPTSTAEIPAHESRSEETGRTPSEKPAPISTPTPEPAAIQQIGGSAPAPLPASLEGATMSQPAPPATIPEEPVATRDAVQAEHRVESASPERPAESPPQVKLVEGPPSATRPGLETLRDKTPPPKRPSESPPPASQHGRSDDDALRSILASVRDMAEKRSSGRPPPGAQNTAPPVASALPPQPRVDQPVVPAPANPHPAINGRPADQAAAAFVRPAELQHPNIQPSSLPTPSSLNPADIPVLHKMPVNGPNGGPPYAPPPPPAASHPTGAAPLNPAARRHRGASADTPVSATGSVLEKGDIVSHIPSKMSANAPAVAEVRLRLTDFSGADVNALADGNGENANGVVTEALTARLRAPGGGFHIENTSPDTLWIDRRMREANPADFGHWRWAVTPTRRGRLRLQLVMSSRTVTQGGAITESRLPDRTVDVLVRGNFRLMATRVAGIAAAVIAGGLLGRFGGPVYDWLAKLY